MEQEPKNAIPKFLLEKIASGSPEGAKLAARLAEVGTGVPVSVSAEDIPRELLALFTAEAQSPLTARVVDTTKKSEE